MANIKIFYLTYCPHSMNTIETLQKIGVNHNAIIADNKKNDIIKENSNSTKNYRYFPQIFYADNFLGGNDKLQHVITTLKNKDIPDKPSEWSRRVWISFLNELSKKL